HTLYKTSPDLSSYAQHDAHETFISLLNLIHSTTRGSTNVSCNCVIHGVFGGQLQVSGGFYWFGFVGLVLAGPRFFSFRVPLRSRSILFPSFRSLTSKNAS